MGGQPFYTAHVQLSNTQEGHEIHGIAPFGLLVYGYGSRTSYMYPGGLDLHIVSIPPPPPINLTGRGAIERTRHSCAAGVTGKSGRESICL